MRPWLFTRRRKRPMTWSVTSSMGLPCLCPWQVNGMFCYCQYYYYVFWLNHTYDIHYNWNNKLKIYTSNIIYHIYYNWFNIFLFWLLFFTRLHNFAWHGTDPNNKTRLIPNQKRFERLQIIPDQFYYNVNNSAHSLIQRS